MQNACSGDFLNIEFRKVPALKSPKSPKITLDKYATTELFSKIQLCLFRSRDKYNAPSISKVTNQPMSARAFKSVNQTKLVSARSEKYKFNPKFHKVFLKSQHFPPPGFSARNFSE